MLRRFLLLGLLIAGFWNCMPPASDNKTDNPVTSEPETLSKTTSKEELTSFFKPIEGSFSLNEESFSDDSWQEISQIYVEEWIHPYSELVKHFDDEKWLALHYSSSENLSSYSLAQIHEGDIRIYLLQLFPEDKGSLTHLGNIMRFFYVDSNEEAGESYHFDITDCENLKLEFRNDSLITYCERYTATVGKDWRVDQNLYVNDTVKLPIIENSYSLY